MAFRIRPIGPDVDGKSPDGTPSQVCIAVDGDWIYWVDSRHRFRRGKLNSEGKLGGNGIVQDIDGPEPDGRPSQVCIAVDGDWIYWVDSRHRFRRGKLNSEGKLGGDGIVQDIDGPEPDGRPSQVCIAVDGDWIYWVDSRHRFRRATLNTDDGLASVQELDGPEPNGEPSQVCIAVDGDWIYWVDSRHRFRRATLDADNKLTLVQDIDGPNPDGTPSQVCIAVDGGQIYWVDSRHRFRKGMVEKYEENGRSRYDEYKAAFLERFLDCFDLAVNLTKDAGNPEDRGDSAWRTGLSTICMALERDHVNTARLLQGLISCWKDGRPVRHPVWVCEPEKTYSRDQFIPQMAACYYAWRFGTPATAALGQELLRKFLGHLLSNDMVLNEGQAAYLWPWTQFVLREVARQMGLPSDWKIKVSNRARKENVRQLFVTLEEKVLNQNPDLPSLAKTVLRGLIRALGESLRNSGDTTVEFDHPQILEALFAANICASVEKVRAGGEAPFEYYSIHNLFWEILLLHHLNGKALGLREATKELARACEIHNMAPLLWIVGDFQKPREWLINWPSDWEQMDYVWQQSLHGQRDPSTNLEFPRLDYMILTRLFDLEISW